MFIITRYVVWEVLKYFVAALLGLTLVVTLGMGVREGLARGLPAVIIVRILPLMLPEMLGITIPVAMLFSVCSVFGRMTGSNEVVALKSLGISPMAVVWPAIVLSAFVSLGTVCMYEIAATWSRPSVKRLIVESIEEIAYSVLQKTGSIDGGQYGLPFAIIVNRIDGQTLIEPTITIKGPPKIRISAAEARLHTDTAAQVLWIECCRGNISVQGQMRMWVPGWEKYPVQIVMPGPLRYHRDWVAMRDIPDRIVELEAATVERQNTLRQLEPLRAASTLLGEPESGADADRIINDIKGNRELILRLKAETYRRWANGFTCLCFALIGAPVAMLWRHADVLTNFFVCFLPILAIYYPLLMLSDDLATSGKLWPISFWTANIALTIPAVLVLRRIIRH